MTYIKIKDVKKLRTGDLATFRFPNETRIDGFVRTPWDGSGQIEVGVGPETDPVFVDPDYFVSARQNVVVELKFQIGERVELVFGDAKPSHGEVLMPQSIASAMFNASPNLVMVKWDVPLQNGRSVASVPETLLRSIGESR